jgi:hypothetical protein
MDETKEKMRENFNWYLQNNKTTKKEFHFLSFNRVTKPHRLVMFAELSSNEKLIGKSIKSLGASQNKFHHEFFNILNATLGEYYVHSKKRLLDFYNTYDSSKHYVYDENDLENNKAANLSKGAHSTTFVNVVTESLIDEGSIFYSENSIKKLKELGFKTFDKWWDESYDNETNYTKRMDMITSVMEEIASWDMDKCYQVTQEMEEVLIHNFNNMISNHEVIKLFTVLENKKISNRLI